MNFNIFLSRHGKCFVFFLKRPFVQFARVFLSPSCKNLPPQKPLVPFGHTMNFDLLHNLVGKENK